MTKPTPIDSPCNQVCTVDRPSRLCAGCLRTIEEITLWGQFSPERRKRIMAELPERRSRLGQTG
ncbi:MAG: DUF1289 domain-containing protein [Rhodobacteraceae bacterium]|nr:DUF1289 domain-containing protein [Paracoccaceae bacterium]